MARNRQVQIFESAIERMGRTLSQHWDIKVIFKANECKTTGKIIYLPTLPDDASPELMQAMQGHLDHEASHVVNSDFKILKRIGRFPARMAVTNAMEDPRIERLWTLMYPGAKSNFRASSEWAFIKHAEEQEMEDENGKKKKMKPWEQLSDLGGSPLNQSHPEPHPTVQDERRHRGPLRPLGLEHRALQRLLRDRRLLVPLALLLLALR